MHLLLERFSYSPEETEGRLFAPDIDPLYTMEQPWVSGGDYPSGEPFKSCIPEGTYRLVPYQRSNGHKVWCLVNEDLGVYFSQAETSQPHHRFKCLIHSGNLVAHTQGCVLPGVRRGVLGSKRAVLQSGFREGYALDRLTKLLGPMSEGHVLTIIQVQGAQFDVV